MFMSTSSQYDPSGRLLAEDVAGDNAPAFSITEISAMLKRTVEDRFGYVKLRGEISGFKRAASGHLYLCLKDENAVIDGVMWKGGAQRLAFRPEDGIEVRSEEHTSELQSLMRLSYAVFCLKNKTRETPKQV